ncbi:acyltransferase family protein [Gallaecimonas mangrovi]|uniref:acyltransferase family protein n=1 Tax=Gallaecimonas mangrovi TaxID=2291597 RepID=UPI000E1FB89E|nr:acyltransferase [Gallaecimonas mangrovi]
MGSVRALLAISVIFAHTYGFVFVGGRLAVELFYMISGFLISYVLLESKTYNNKKAFYINRFLRIYPLYWVVLIITLFCVFLSVHFLNTKPMILDTFSKVSVVGKLVLLFSNTFIFGQDWVMFTSVKNGFLQFSSDFRDTEIEMWTGLAIPQAWTLGVELTFYLIAPFLLKNIKLILVFLGCSLLVKAYLIFIGLGFSDPWDYRFFPAELSLFLLGAVAHQVLKPFFEKKIKNRSISNAITIFIFSYCVLFFILPNEPLNHFLLIFLFFIALPFIFRFQFFYKWDRKVGELSYPIYISHMLVVVISKHFLNYFNLSEKSLSGSIIIIMSTIAFSYLLHLIVERNIERLRNVIKISKSINKD